MVTQHPKVEGSEKWGVKCSAVKWVKWSEDLWWRSEKWGV